jgi:hypothetical protein
MRLAWLSLVLVVAGSARGEDSGWKAGVAKTHISPKGPVYMAGYAARKTPSEGIDCPLEAKALALRDEQGHTILWFTADVIGFDRPLTEAVLHRVCSQHGLKPESVALFASHTHTGPVLKVSEESLRERDIDPKSEAAQNTLAFRHDLEDALVKLASHVLNDKSLGRVTVSYGVGKAGFAMNRREKTATGYKIGVNPEGPTDKSVSVLVVRDPTGKIIAFVFGYACHNTTLTDKAMRLSGDYAGFAQQHLEETHPGSFALFLTGCAGDANPEPRGTLELARQHGRALADAVDAVLEAPMTPLSGPIRSAFTERTIRFAGPTGRAAYEQRLKEPGSGRQAHAKKMLALLDAGKPIQTEYVYPVQAFALGNRLTLLALAGEVVADYSVRLQKELGGAEHPLWVTAYANDVFGYVGSARVIREGGYEGLEAYYYSSFPTPLDEGVEEIVIDAATEVVRKVRQDAR